MDSNQGLQPWNDRKLTRDLLGTVRALERRPYEGARVPAVPGVYAMFTATQRPSMVDLFTETVAHGMLPCYVGSSGTNVRARLMRYRQILRDLPGFDLSEIWISVLPCDSRAAALYAEAALLDSPVAPVLNRVGGFGSMTPGARRRSQRSSPIDALFAPGRQWVRPPTIVDQVRARCTLLAALAEIDPSGPRWPSLVSTRQLAAVTAGGTSGAAGERRSTTSESGAPSTTASTAPARRRSTARGGGADA
jgi:hypothetical protein